MTLSSVRLENSDGEVWTDPTEETLYNVLDGLVEPGAFVIVERTADPGEEVYAQAIVADDGSLTMEYRDGGPDRHYQATAPDVTTARAVLAGWASGGAGWREALDWRPLDVDADNEAADGPAGDADAPIDWSDPGTGQVLALPAMFSAVAGIGVAWVVQQIAGTTEFGFLSMTAGVIIGIVVPLVLITGAWSRVLRHAGENAVIGFLLVAPAVVTAAAIILLAGVLP